MKWMVFFNLIAIATFAQEDQPWKKYYDSTQLYWAKDWGKTVSLLENAERSALSDLGLYHENYLTILNDLGTAYWKAKDFNRAEKLLAQSLTLKSEVYPKNDKEVILSMSNLAGFYAERGLWQQSKTLYQQILSSDPRLIPDIYVTAAQNLVSLYDMNQQPDSANLMLHRIERLDFIPVNSFLAFQHKFYRARVNRKLQKYQEAGRDLEAVLASLADRQEPELKELYVQSLQEQGILFLETGSYSRAERILLDAYQKVTAEMNRDFFTH